MITYSEYKGHPVVTLTIGGVGGHGFTFGLAKAMLVLANIEELRAWVAKENEQETICEIACPDCGATWVWAHDMPDMPYKPAPFTEAARCPACKDAEAELLARAPLAGIEILDLNSILQLTAGETAKVEASPMFAVPHTPTTQNTLELRPGTMPGQSKQRGKPVQPALLSARETVSAINGAAEVATDVTLDPAQDNVETPKAIDLATNDAYRGTRDLPNHGRVVGFPRERYVDSRTKWSAEALARSAEAREVMNEWFPRRRCEVCGKVHDGDGPTCEYCLDVVGSQTVTQYQDALMGEF